MSLIEATASFIRDEERLEVKVVTSHRSGHLFIMSRMSAMGQIARCYSKCGNPLRIYRTVMVVAEKAIETAHNRFSDEKHWDKTRHFLIGVAGRVAWFFTPWALHLTAVKS